MTQRPETAGAGGATAPPAEPLIALRGLSVSFAGLSAVRDLDLTIYPGEAVGIVGESGSGKSVTWLAILRLLASSAVVTGKAMMQGTDLLELSERQLSAVRGRRLGLIFQDPISSLNPVKRVGVQVGEAIRLHRGLAAAQARDEARKLLELVGIPDAGRRMDRYPHELSGGQNQRIMIAMALAGHPQLLIADEPTTALDVTIQAQILALLERIRDEMNTALVLISHDLSVVGEVCDRIAVMYAGRIVETAPSRTLFARPLHPYTRGLLDAAPALQVRRERLLPIPGHVPEPWNMPPGCPFQPRCGFATDACALAPPPLRPVGEEHASACIRVDDLPPHQGRTARNVTNGLNDVLA